MTEWAARRFWSEVTLRERPDGIEVLLDGRPVRTPGRAPFLAPTRALAERVAAEWRNQGEAIDPSMMPFTRSLNSAIDKVAPRPGPVVEALAAFGESDLLCYRATSPAELTRRQADAWDPYLDWAAKRFGARLTATAGLMPVTQPAGAIGALRAALSDLDPFALTAAHDLITLSGSLVLGLSGIHGAADGAALWAAACIDEDWQIEQWGRDDEAAAAASARWRAFSHALAFHAAARSRD